MKLYEAFGEKKTINDWSRDSRCICSKNTLWYRVNRMKMVIEQALTTTSFKQDASLSIGEIYGYLKVMEISGSTGKTNQTLIKCQCLYNNCGNIFETRLNSVRRKETISCGCYAIEQVKKRMITHGLTSNVKDGKYIYSLWERLQQKCFNPNNEKFKDYGGRGITVCEEWKFGQLHNQGLLNFYEWYLKNPRPSKLYSLDRINNNLGYSPKNCKWSTASEQTKNQRPRIYNAEFNNLNLKYQLALQEIEKLKEEINTFKNYN